MTIRRREAKSGMRWDVVVTAGWHEAIEDVQDVAGCEAV